MSPRISCGYRWTIATARRDDAAAASEAVEGSHEGPELRGLSPGPPGVDLVLPILEIAQLAFATAIRVTGQDVGGKRVVVAGLAPPGRVADLRAVGLPIFVHARVGLGAGEDEEALARYPAAHGTVAAAELLDEIHGLTRRLRRFTGEVEQHVGVVEHLDRVGVFDDLAGLAQIGCRRRALHH